MIDNELVNSVKSNEGFKSKPYIDSLVLKEPEKYNIVPNELNIIKKNFNKLKVTFGYGFTYITDEEAALVLNKRLYNTKLILFNKLPWLQNQPDTVQDVLIEMAYQMGVSGLLEFTDTLKYCKQKNYDKMADEMKDSDWYKQTTDRANKLINKIKGVNNER